MFETGDMNVLACTGVCNYPNGKLGIAAVVVSILSFILATVATYSCQFFSVEDGLGIGAFKWYATSALGCQSYDILDGYDEYGYYYDFEVGAMTKFARAMGILGTVFGILALVATLSLSCMSMPNLILKSVSVMNLVSGVCVMLVWMVLSDCDLMVGEGYTCTIGSGAVVSIVAFCFYFVAAAIVFKIPRYDSDGGATRGSRKEYQVKNAKAQAQGKNVTIEKILLDDGGQKIIKTTIDEEGNKTIEETFEEPPEEQYPEPEFTKRVLPDGSIQTLRISYDEEGCKIVTETIEPGGSFSDDSV